MLINKQDITTLILAGGKSSRMGGNDKGLIKINDEYIMSELIELSEKFTNSVILNINRNKDIYEKFKIKLISDLHVNFQGPLAGIYSGMTEAKTKYILVLPCDCPMISDIFFKDILKDNFKDKIRCAHDGNRLQPVHALIDRSMVSNLKVFLDSGERKIDKWYNQEKLEIIDFSNNPQFFMNINTPEDLEKYKLEKMKDDN